MWPCTPTLPQAFILRKRQTSFCTLYDDLKNSLLLGHLHICLSSQTLGSKHYIHYYSYFITSNHRSSMCHVTLRSHNSVKTNLKPSVLTLTELACSFGFVVGNLFISFAIRLFSFTEVRRLIVRNVSIVFRC